MLLLQTAVFSEAAGILARDGDGHYVLECKDRRVLLGPAHVEGRIGPVVKTAMLANHVGSRVVIVGDMWGPPTWEHYRMQVFHIGPADGRRQVVHQKSNYTMR